MKRWLLVVAPAVLIAVGGLVLLSVTDSDPEPLPPLATGPATPVLSPSPVTRATGATGEPTGGEETGAEGVDESPSPVDSGESGLGTPTPQAGNVTYELVLVEAGSVNPQLLQAQQGDTIELEVRSVDVTGRLFVQGFDVAESVSPGTTVTIVLQASETGTFPILLEGSDTMVAQILVTP